MSKTTDLTALFTVSPKDIKRSLGLIMEAGLVPFVRSSPGRGKSAIARQLADELELELIDIRLSMYESYDFNGLPFPNHDVGLTQFLPVDLFPLDTTPLPEGKRGWFILLDEFTHAEPEMIRASYKLVLDRMVGMRHLHDNAFIMLAGNGIDDNALANNVGTAINNRVTHITLGSDVDFWLTDVAAKFGYDHRIIGYLSANKNDLNDFDPENDDHAFCSERSWEFVSKLIKGVDNLSGYSPLVAGTITPGVAASFMQFCEIYKNLVHINDVVKDPENCAIPSDSATRWALVTHLANACTEDNLTELCAYMDRFVLQYTMIFLRMLDHSLLVKPAASKLLSRVGRAINA